jgi:hypothetical protein
MSQNTNNNNNHNTDCNLVIPSIEQPSQEVLQVSSEQEKEKNLLTLEETLQEIRLTTSLQSDAEIENFSQQLLTLVNQCIPKATSTYENSPKKSNADALNLFISQSREIVNDLRSVRNKRVQVNKIVQECLSPAFTTIRDQLLSAPIAYQDLGEAQYMQEVDNIMKLLAKSVVEKLKETL